jgi:probable phosphoglycerate mutase
MEVKEKSVYIIRHGETEWSLSGQHTGITDIPLTENGRDAAKILQPFLTKQSFVLVLTSPLQRAKETCKLSGLGDRAEVESNLMEWNYGDYEGLTSAQIHETAPGWIVFNDGAPRGETPEQVAVRADRVIARVRSVKGDVALFAHGHILRVLVARWLDLPATAGRNFLLGTGTLNILSYYRGYPAIQTWNAPLTP